MRRRGTKVCNLVAYLRDVPKLTRAEERILIRAETDKTLGKTIKAQADKIISDRKRLVRHARERWEQTQGRI